MALDNTYQPPVTYPIRPLNKGMIRNLPSNGIPEGSFLRVQNYRVHEYGLKRRGGYVPFNLNNGNTEETSYDEQLVSLIYYWSATSTPEMLLLGNKHLMVMGSNGETTTKVYPNIAASETEYPATSIGAYNEELYTMTIVLTATEAQSERMYVGSEIFFKDASNGDSVELFGTVSNVTYTSPNIVTLILNVGIEEPSPLPLITDTFLAREVFVTTENMGLSHAVVPPSTFGDTGKVLFADQGGNGLYEYVDGVLQTFVTESSVDGLPESTQYFDSAHVITYYDDRLWVGNTIEEGTRFTQRIRWSDPVNFSRFQPINYVDLPYSGGELINLMPLGSLLVAYYTDAIYIGRPTNIATRPYLFERLETGKMGLITQKAIVAWNDGHFFVGTDNIYSLTMNGALAPIGSPVLEETLEHTKRLELSNFIQVEHDPGTESIVFLFPDVVDDTIPMTSISTKLWRMNYKTLGWSYDEVNFEDNLMVNPNFYYGGLLPTRFYTSGKTWEAWQGNDSPDTEITTYAWMPLKSVDENYENDIPDPTIDFGNSFWDTQSWDNLKAEVLLAKKLYLPVWRKSDPKELIVEELDRENDTLGENDASEVEITYPIWTVLESMDYDFGAPDQSKTVTRLGCKLFDNQMVEFKDSVKSILSELRFTLNISDRMGYKWKRPITFGFKDNYNEGFANFRATGSTFRYKLVNGQSVLPYKLSEMTLRVVGRGLQTTN